MLFDSGESHVVFEMCPFLEPLGKATCILQCSRYMGKHPTYGLGLDLVTPMEMERNSVRRTGLDER